MVRRLTIAALGWLAIASAAAQTHVGIASINLCTDQLLLDLADRSAIMGLSPFARDAALSPYAARAAALPLLSGTAEELMVLRPALVLASSYTKPVTREFLRARGIRTEEFNVPRTIAEAQEQVARAAALLGREAAGQARIAGMDEALARLRAASGGLKLSVLPLSRRGWAAGRDSLHGDLLAAAGLSIAGGRNERQLGGFLSLEAIVALKPDAIVVTEDDEKAEDQGRAMLLHPAIQALFPQERRIVLPESLVVCGGPALIDAMDRLAAQIGKLKPRERSAR
jgi:iron complex transport system substrate-binding protein